MKEESIIILIRDYNYFFKYIRPKYLMKIYKYGKNNKDTIIKKIIFKLKLPIYPFMLDKWKKNIKDCNVVVVFDNGYHPLITKYIKKKNKDCIVKFYFWNSVTELNKRVFEDTNIDEFWTFDSNDAKTYNMNYNPQFYTNKVKLENDKYLYDALFLGRPKNRRQDIIDIKNDLERNDLKTNIIIVEEQKDYINYDNYLKLLNKSKCVIDITNSEQIGLSLRPMEALFLEKKLITNNKDIKNYDFYNPNNIFIIGEDSKDKIKEFINTPFEPIDEKIVDYYDFENWIKRLKK